MNFETEANAYLAEVEYELSEISQRWINEIEQGAEISNSEQKRDHILKYHTTIPLDGMFYEFEPLMALDELMADAHFGCCCDSGEPIPGLNVPGNKHMMENQYNASTISLDSFTALGSATNGIHPPNTLPNAADQTPTEDVKEDDIENNNMLDATGIIGLNSKQMLRVLHMIEFLKASELEKDKELLTIFQNVTADCIEFHLAGYCDYKHLPGSIFQSIVTRIDGIDFVRVFKATKKFPHSQLNPSESF